MLHESTLYFLAEGLSSLLVAINTKEHKSVQLLVLAFNGKHFYTALKFKCIKCIGLNAFN